MIQAIERNLQECFRSFHILPGSNVIDNDEVVALQSAIRLNFLNGVALAKFCEDDAEEKVAKMIERFKSANTMFRWWLTPSSTPSHLGNILASHGMERRYEIPGMAVSLSDINTEITAPPDFTIQRVTDQETLAIWSRTFAKGFEMAPGDDDRWAETLHHFGFAQDSPWHAYLGYLGGEPIATSAMFLGSEAAGIYHVVTLPHARGKGIGSLITLEPLKEARASGYKTGVLQSSDMGLRVYERLGFRSYFKADFYLWRPI